MLIEIMMVTAFVSFAILIYTTETGLFGTAALQSALAGAPPQLMRARRAAMMLPSVADKGADVLKPVRPRCTHAAPANPRLTQPAAPRSGLCR